MAPLGSNAAAAKAGLRATKAAIDVKKFQDAISHAEGVLQIDSENYLALVFLGHSNEKLRQREKAEKAYLEASKLKPDDDKAWLGLRSLYGETVSISEFIKVSFALAKIYLDQESQDKCQSVINKAVTLAQQRGSKEQYCSALELQLPDGPFYSFLEGRLPAPAHTFLRLAEATEELETAKIDKDIGEQRTRIGARKADVAVNVKRAVYSSSKLAQYYQGFIDWTNDDEQRREFEEKKLSRACDYLYIAKQEDKDGLRGEVIETAHGMVIIKRPFELAWEIELEWQDFQQVSELDIAVLRQYIAFFPSTGLAKVLTGYLLSEQSPFPKEELSTGSDDEQGGVALGDVVLETEEDLMLGMNDGLEEAECSLLAHRLMSEYYLQIEDEETSVETTRKGLVLVSDYKKKTGLKYHQATDALNTTLGTALIKYQSPRHHSEAKKLFQSILKRRPNFTPALLGTGLILEEEEDFAAALDYLRQALKRDSTDVTISAEAAWCSAMIGNWTEGLAELQRCLKKIDKIPIEDRSKRTTGLRAQILYRAGRCGWEIDPSRANRKDRKHGPFASFLESVKTDPNYAPAYTSLGTYYEDYARDGRRARQCFQRAFDLSPSEVFAAERLARSFAELGDWDVVEIIAQRVVDSGKARVPPPIPGLPRKKGISWPYSALGVVQLNRQDYHRSSISFRHALRINPDDYHSYVGLGESYHNSGRYNSALRTFTLAENPEDGMVMNKGTTGSNEDWFTRYMLANVSRELGDHDEAIEAYEKVLDARPGEFGVEIALLQTWLERASSCLETGFFGRAVDSAARSLHVAASVVQYKPEAFNLWKAVADACSIFVAAPDRIDIFPGPKVLKLLQTDFELEDYDTAALNVDDGIGKAQLKKLSARDHTTKEDSLVLALCGSVLAHKRALHCVASDHHAHAVAWYNLGFAQYQAHAVADRRLKQWHKHQNERLQEFSSKKLLRAAVSSFKRAIELEHGNAEFWNALGIATSTLNARVSQHAFVRSLHIDPLRSPSAWTSLGSLALLKNDVELAHNAFTKGQAADPDYAAAWTGEGDVAMLLGDRREAFAHFEHAVGISESNFVPAREAYMKLAFDRLRSGKQSDSAAVLQPILLCLHQFRALRGAEPSFEHLAALFRERAGDFQSAARLLQGVCAGLEAEYEADEGFTTLVRFAQAKADLARNLLATNEFARAEEEAETALNLTEEEDDAAGATDVSALRQKIRLSARLTLGLSSFYVDETDKALDAFRLALQETGAAPDVVCALAQVLWARGGARERKVAKERLFEAFTSSSSSATAEETEASFSPVLMLGAMAVIERPPDLDTAEAVHEELEAIRLRSGLGKKVLDEIHLVHGALEDTLFAKRRPEMRSAAQKSVMLFPCSPDSWSRLANVVAGGTEDAAPAATALRLAARRVAPRGDVSAAQLARAFARTGGIADAQRAIMIKPGEAAGWRTLVYRVTQLAGG